MELVFKDPVSGDQVKDTDFKQHFPNVNGKTEWNSFKVYIRQATKEYVLPYLGEELYNDIASKVNGDNVPASLVQFVKDLKDVVAYYTMYHALPINAMVFSNFGNQEAQSTDGKSQPVRQWIFNSSIWSIIQSADKMMDSLLAYMEKNLTVESNYFQTNWKDLDIYLQSRDDVFLHTKELSKYVDINNSRRAYIRLLPHIRSAKQRFLKPILCQDQLDGLIAAIKAGNANATQTALIEKVKPVLANYALLIGIPHIRVVLSGEGISVTTLPDRKPISGSITSGNSAASDADIMDLTARIKADAETFRADLIEFLYENEDDYPLWKESDCYESDEDNDFIDPSDQHGAVMFF